MLGVTNAHHSLIKGVSSQEFIRAAFGETHYLYSIRTLPLVLVLMGIADGKDPVQYIIDSRRCISLATGQIVLYNYVLV